MPPAIRIKKVSDKRGLIRYRVGFQQGMPVEFMMCGCPAGSQREWNVLFARTLAKNLMFLADCSEDKWSGK